QRLKRLNAQQRQRLDRLHGRERQLRDRLRGERGLARNRLRRPAGALGRFDRRVVRDRTYVSRTSRYRDVYRGLAGRAPGGPAAPAFGVAINNIQPGQPLSPAGRVALYNYQQDLVVNDTIAAPERIVQLNAIRAALLQDGIVNRAVAFNDAFCTTVASARS